MKEKFNFTKREIEKLPPATQGKRAYYYDTKVFGLELMITSTGSKSFKVYRRINNKPDRVSIGKFPDTTVENARKKAIEINNRINEGINPNELKRKIRNEQTFKEIFDKYIDEYGKLHTKTWQQDIDDVERNLKPWLNKSISKITPADVRKMHSDRAQKTTSEDGKKVFGGKDAANRLLDRINAVFNKAIEWGWEGKNPAKGVKKFKTKSRERFLQPEELPRFFEALEAETNKTTKDFIHIALLTGARKSNVLAMRWDEISFDRAEWRIPETKNGEALTLPLVEDALRILKARKKSSADKYVFEGEGRTGHLADPRKAWMRILKKAGIEDLRLHDLRRSLGSYQAILGANSYTIGKSLGHKSQAATAIYARMNLDPVRASMEAATKMMKGVKENG